MNHVHWTNSRPAICHWGLLHSECGCQRRQHKLIPSPCISRFSLFQNPNEPESVREDCKLKLLMDALHDLFQPSDGFTFCVALLVTALMFIFIKGSNQSNLVLIRLPETQGWIKASAGLTTWGPTCKPYLYGIPNHSMQLCLE